MGVYKRISWPKGTGQPLDGAMVNERTGEPIDLRRSGTTMVLTAQRQGEQPVIVCEYDADDNSKAGIDVDAGNPGNTYTVALTADATAGELHGALLPFELILVEPDAQPDKPVFGHFVIV